MNLECLMCKRMFTANKFVRHLNSCIPKQVSTKKVVQHVLIRVRPEYFGHLAYFLIPGNDTLEDLDDILRSFWLDCCDEHLSDFYLKKEELSMDLKLRRFQPKTKLDYMFDYSKTTYLTVEILKPFDFGLIQENLFWLLAQNEPFEYVCDVCHKGKAVQLIPEGRGEEGFFCQACFAKSIYADDDYDEDYCLPVVNSPRMGICEYMGPKTQD